MELQKSFFKKNVDLDGKINPVAMVNFLIFTVKI